MNAQLEDLLGQILKNVVNLKGVNLLYGDYTAGVKMKGADNNMNPLNLAEPTLVFDRRDMPGTPINFYFKIVDNAIRLHYDFRIQSTMDGVDPLMISDLEVKLETMVSNGKFTYEPLKVFLNAERPQIAGGTKDWHGLDEFIALKEAIESDRVGISWTAKIQWVDISSKEMQDNIKNPQYKPQPKTATISGHQSIHVTQDSASHKSMFEGVKSLLRWEYEIIDDHKVYFKDPMKDDFIYFLPQEYRIKALESNAPDITTEIVEEDGQRKVLMRFHIAPFTHPNAKRDAYKIFQKRKGKNFCNLRLGGIESARFEWGGEMVDGKLYGENGFTSIMGRGDPKESETTASEFDFFIVLEVPSDGLVELFQEKLMKEGIVVANLYFEVKDGLDDELIELDPLPVKLNLHKLTGITPHVAITSCSWPNYVARITNTGQYSIEIGGAALSVIRREKNQVKEAIHEMKTSAQFPTVLKKGASMEVALTTTEAERIKHRKLLGIGKVDVDYWSEYICEPYHIRLADDKTLKDVMAKTNESAAYEHKTWELTIIPNFHWSDNPDVTAIQVEIKNSFGVDEVVTLTEENSKPKIPMVNNLNADIKTQQAGKQKFKYRIRAIKKSGPRNPEWGEWGEESGDTLFIYSDDI